MKVTFSLSFYHIPKFLKNDLIKRLEINIHHHLDGMLISKLSEAVYGGAKRDRTADLLRARQALSQLSYGPITKLVGLGRFELPTSPLSGVRSNHLSYRPGRLFRNSLDGGACRDRTDDPLLAKQVLSQLS